MSLRDRSHSQHERARRSVSATVYSVVCLYMLASPYGYNGFKRYAMINFIIHTAPHGGQGVFLDEKASTLYYWNQAAGAEEIYTGSDPKPAYGLHGAAACVYHVL